MTVLISVAILLGPSLQQAIAVEASAPGSSFDPAQVRKGAQLAAIGNCVTCHTAPNGKPFAGGSALNTPFGAIYGTNITPDPETGIGKWSRADFLRAMHDGVDRSGRHLYPVFPYDHFTKVTEEDVNAIYAFLMTRESVRAKTPSNELGFPFNIRATLVGWNLLFFRKGVFESTPSKGAQWNRGAYLVEGLGHCADCHTPRNFLGAENKALDFNGGESEGWHAPALNAASPVPTPWTADHLIAYLRHGIDDVHEVAAGPMAPVVHFLAQVPEDDVRAIAIYVASLGGGQTAPHRTSRAVGTGQGVERGAAIYASTCAACHDKGRQVPGGSLQLSLSTSVNMPTPDNLIRIVRDGIVPVEGEPVTWMMPPFASVLTDQQIADVVVYLRAHFGEKPAWNDVSGYVRKISSNKSK